jgi:hypothetical protein
LEVLLVLQLLQLLLLLQRGLLLLLMVESCVHLLLLLLLLLDAHLLLVQRKHRIHLHVSSVWRFHRARLLLHALHGLRAAEVHGRLHRVHVRVGNSRRQVRSLCHERRGRRVGKHGARNLIRLLHERRGRGGGHESR